MVTVDLIQNDHNQPTIDLKNVKNGTIKYIENELPQKDILVELVISDPESIHKLNLEYRDKDKTTDVLSFPIFNSKAEIIKNPGLTNIGTIVINLEKSIMQSADNKRTPEEETIFLCQHSIEHLLGHHHPE